jgi:alkyldihydroxyacetonephosphate synthase
MRRWNGWGEETTIYPFPASAASYLSDLIGEGEKIPDASLDSVLANVPISRLPDYPLVSQDPQERLRHARGQSLPDWVALRHGKIETFPDGVAYPADEEEVCAVLDFAHQVGARLIPYGGGTSVVGHINPLPGDAPILTVDISRMDQLLDLDQTSRLATFQAGVAGPKLEAQLNQRGYTLGHFPQSFELSTLGGWIATRSSGQQSYHYGRIEDLFAGGRVETPRGALDLPLLPASAAGPDLRQVILGSEGRLGVITRATVRILAQPRAEAFYGIFFHNWESGAAAVRQTIQAGTPISMARLSNPRETDTTLKLSGKDNLVAWADRGLRLLAYGQERCLLIYGVTGNPAITRIARRQANAIARAHGGLFTGEIVGRTWRKSRFLTPYLRNALWESGYAVDTLETAVPWSKVLETERQVQQAMHAALAPTGERALIFAHLSHVYVDGASIYVTYIFRRSPDPDKTLERWQAMKTAASQAILAQGGTISHQHGVGLDHAPFLVAEKGILGMDVLQNIARTLDPDGIMNPGKLLA